MGIDTAGLDTETMRRVIEKAQQMGMPLTPQTFSGILELANSEGGGAQSFNNGREDAGDPLSALMARTDGTAPITPVTSAPLVTPLPTQKPTRTLADMNLRPGAGMDEIAFGNMQDEMEGGPGDNAREERAENSVPRSKMGLNRGLDNIAAGNLNDEALGIRRGQGPARLNSHDAEAPNAADPDKIAYGGNTKNSPPGMQDDSDPGGISDISAIGAGGTGMLAALIATLTKRRNVPSLGQSIHLGDAMAKPAINQYEGVVTPATQSEMKKSRVTGKRRKSKQSDD